MLMNYHIGRLVLSSLCVGAFGAAGFWWCWFFRLKHNCCDTVLNILYLRCFVRVKVQVSFLYKTEGKTV